MFQVLERGFHWSNRTGTLVSTAVLRTEDQVTEEQLWHPEHCCLQPFRCVENRGNFSHFLFTPLIGHTQVVLELLCNNTPRCQNRVCHLMLYRTLPLQRMSVSDVRFSVCLQHRHCITIYILPTRMMCAPRIVRSRWGELGVSTLVAKRVLIKSNQIKSNMSQETVSDRETTSFSSAC